MKGFVTNIEQEALENEDFRRVLYTAEHCQLVLMSIAPSDDIGEEVHDVDQLIRIEEGEGQSVLDGVERGLSDGSVVVIPAGVRHNIRNLSDDESLKLYTLHRTIGMERCTRRRPMRRRATSTSTAVQPTFLTHETEASLSR